MARSATTCTPFASSMRFVRLINPVRIQSSSVSPVLFSMGRTASRTSPLMAGGESSHHEATAAAATAATIANQGRRRDGFNGAGAVCASGDAAVSALSCSAATNR